MKAVIFAGGFGTRLSEETIIKPKPMIGIGEYPIIWHILKIYESYGVKDFVILAGYKANIVKEYFLSYYYNNRSVSVSLKNNKIEVLDNDCEDWNVTILDTGLSTMTGGRLLRAKEIIGDEQFFLTYGDGVSNVNINALLNKHNNSSTIATVTAVRPGGRFGVLDMSNGKVSNFIEKPDTDGGWINGGFFVCEPEIFKYISDDTTVFEQQPLNKISSIGELSYYKHEGFWQCMDTLNDKNKLVNLWETGDAPWKVWD